MLENWRRELLGIRTELNAVEPNDERERVMRLTEWRVSTRWGRWSSFYSFGAVYSAMLFFAMAFYPWVFGFSLARFVPPPLDRILCGSSVFVLYGVIVSYVGRAAYRRALRETLNERGIPVCMACGYNLTGVAERRCPECGTGIDDVGGGGVGA